MPGPVGSGKVRVGEVEGEGEREKQRKSINGIKGREKRRKKV